MMIVRNKNRYGQRCGCTQGNALLNITPCNNKSIYESVHKYAYLYIGFYIYCLYTFIKH